MIGRAIESLYRLPKQHFPLVCFEQKVFSHLEWLEESLNVAVEQWPLLRARRLVRAVLQVGPIHDYMPGIGWPNRGLGIGGAEKREQDTARLKHARQLAR
jgi:hypothetical protein